MCELIPWAARAIKNYIVVKTIGLKIYRFDKIL
jgi:hypothetical protein